MSVMEGTKDTHNGIVQEVLTKDNYEIWKTLMKNYLLGKNLWAAVEGDSVSTRVGGAYRTRRTAKMRKMDADVDARRRMDAEALHIIQVSCGSKILDEIRKKKIQTAKDTWNFLALRYHSDEKAKEDIEQGIVDNTIDEYRDLYKDVERGDWRKVESLMKVNRDMLFKRSESGRTILHVATMAGQEKIVEGLVNMGKEKLVEMKDEKGYTALALAAHYTGNVDVANHMVEKGDNNVLTIRTQNHYIPLVLAASKGHKELTRYLYRKTPTNFLSGPDPHDRVLLLKRSIKAEIFDVALGLLESYTNLPAESISDPEGFVALRALAQMPSAFFSSSKFGFLHGFIYNILRVENKFQDSYCFIGTGIVPGDGHYKADSSGRFCRSVLNILLCPVRFLGWRPLKEIVYLFVQFFKLLNIFGIRKVYDQKCTHYQVRQILRFLQLSVANFRKSELHQASVYDAMLDAAKHGIVELINAMTEANYDLLWAIDGRKRGIFSYAVLYRKENVFKLINTLNGRKDIIKSRDDVFGNNLLHLAAHLGPSSDLNRRPGAALQMQREIHWFKAVEEVVHPKCKEARNEDDKKPKELFTEMHKQLVIDGEKWAKEASNSYILVGILITTVMFAAAFTVPGGNNQDTGVPILLNERIFTVFVVADAVSLFTSATSVLIFIGVLTSRYAEKDFRIWLPFKLFWGLFFLFLSVVFMVVAFCSALAIVVNKYWAYKRLFIGGACMGCFPVLVLVPSQLKLMYEILRSTLSNPIRRKIK